MEHSWPPAPEEEIDSLDAFSYVYKCDHCKAEVTLPPTVSPIIAQDIVVSENPDWIFRDNETFCSKSCQSEFDSLAQ